MGGWGRAEVVGGLAASGSELTDSEAGGVRRQGFMIWMKGIAAAFLHMDFPSLKAVRTALQTSSLFGRLQTVRVEKS